MSRTFSVIVLCPNGRRETVKVSPNNSILQVLEEACQKQNINAGDYDIRHYNKTLDLSLPIRFANLPNNAQLELRPAANPRKDSIITVGLHLESGERIMGDFPPSATVSNVLEKCLSSESVSLQEAGEPVCIYMRQKITGDALESTTLRSLGLTKGTAMIRLLYRKPEELEHQAHVSSPLTAPAELTAPQHIEQQTPVSPVPEPIKKHARLDATTEEQDRLLNVEAIKVEEEMVADSNENFPKNVASQQSPDVCEDKHPSLKQENRDLSGSIKVEPADQKSQMECTLETEEDTFEGISDINYIGERHAVIYSLDDINDVKKADLPDDFFDLTINDAKYLMSEYSKMRDEIENQPLLTKEQRQRQVLQNLASYTQTVIRIYFPERLVLQAVFSVIETVQNVSDFVSNFLEDEELKFYLYITPPKEKLNPNKTLLEAMLVPAAVVYFGCDLQLPSYLAENLRSRLSDPRAAALAAFESRKDCKSNELSPQNLPFLNSSTVLEERAVSQNATPAASGMQHSSNKPQEKLPKWLKLSKK